MNYCVIYYILVSCISWFRAPRGWRDAEALSSPTVSVYDKCVGHNLKVLHRRHVYYC